MTNTSTATEEKSAESLAFVHWLRTGQSLSAAQWGTLQERKYNHNHDELGKFTFSGGQSIGHNAVFHSWTAHPTGATATRPSSTARTPDARLPHVPHPTGHTAANRAAAAHPASPSPFTQVGTHPARVYRTKAGAAIIDPRSGQPMLVPVGVSIRNTAREGQFFGSSINREIMAIPAFSPSGRMDFQRTYSTLRDRQGTTLIDQRFIAIGNYNFGVYAAASGMSLDRALSGAAKIYFLQTLHTHGNKRNESLIASGYRDYINGNIGD
ncbi:MAG: hypothetical protein ABIM50_04615 [Novosphingobium sp.]